MSTTIEAEVVQPENPMALAVREAQPVGLFGTNEPAAVVEKATSVANALKDVIVKQGLVSKISGKEYPRCEAWTLLGTMLGVFPVTTWTKQIEGGWEARVEARTKDGSIIGAAEAQCLRSERNWSNRDDFALRSMAQTRATAKCLRMPLGFVMTLAGFEATPAEEMVTDHPRPSPQAAPGRAASTPPSATPRQPSKPPISQPAKPPEAKKGPPPPATEETRAKMIARLEKLGLLDLGLEYFHALDKPTLLLPTEGWADIPMEWLPITTAQMWLLQEKIKNFGNGDQAEHPYKPNPRGEAAAAPPSAKSGEAKPKPHVESAKAKDPEWWRKVVVPVPYKGQKRDEYMKAPETVGQLYDRRHEDGPNRRLFGFINHFEVQKTWTNGQGQTVMRSQVQVDTDTLFRDALDACAEFHEKHDKDTEHRQPKDAADEQTQAEAEAAEAEEDNSDVPF